MKNRVDEILSALGMPPEDMDPEYAKTIVAGAQSNRHRNGGKEIEQCGKLGWESESAAKRAKAYRLRVGGNTSFLRVYKCLQCRHWHLTSKRP